MLSRYHQKFQAGHGRWEWRKRLGFLAWFSLLGTSAAIGVEHHAQPNTSWVAPAPRSAEGHAPLDLRQRMILDTIFRTDAPLLTKPASGAPAKSAPSAARTERVAVRPEVVDGWRASDVVIAPQSDASPFNPLNPAGLPNDDVLPHEAPADEAPVIEPADRSSKASDESRPPITVQFRAPRLGRPAATQPAIKNGEPTNTIAGDFDNVESLVRQSERDSIATGGNAKGGAAVTGPVISAPTGESIANIPNAPMPANDASADVSSVGAPVNDGLKIPAAADTRAAQQDASETPTPTDSLVPVEDLPKDSHDESANGTLEDEPTEPAAPVVQPPPPLTRQLVNLRSRVRSVLNGYYRKALNSREHDPWEVMHGMLAYEVKSRVRQGGPRGEFITSVGWLCYNKPCKGQTMMHVTRDGQLRAKYGVGLQGHLGQLLAMLAQCRVSADYPIRVGGHQFTIQDLIEAEKKTCYPKSELTFKLLAFQYYLDLNEKWVNDQGLQWDFPRLIREELAQSMRGAACGGTHRLSSLSLTVKARVRRGEPLDGEYARAAEFVQKHHQYAFRLQNRDGSLSTSWFNGRGDESDINRRIKTTGHILEWLCYSLSDEELRDQRTIRAVTYLANLMYSNYNNEWEVGPMCHATHALLLYDERVFQPHDQPGYAAPYRPRPATATRASQDTRR